MGCGVSTLDLEDATMSRRSNRHHRLRGIFSPPRDNNFYTIPNKKDFENGDEGVNALGSNKEMKPISLGDEEAKMKEVRTNNNNNNNEKLEEERVFESQGKEKHDNMLRKNVKNINIGEEDAENNNKSRYDAIIAPGSPSFRDYCIVSNSKDRSSAWDSNDYDSEESTHHCSEDESTKMKNNLKDEEIVNCNMEPPEKKERRGRGYRNVMNNGKPRGKRNLLNFGCYTSSKESYAENSFNKTA